MIIDLIFAVLVIFAFIQGMRKGFILALFSVLAFVIGMAAALKLSAVVAVKLSESTNVSGKWLPFVAFILVFIVVVFLVNMGGRLIQQAFTALLLGWVNKIAGVLLFVLVYSIIYSIFLFYAVQLQLIKENSIDTSNCYGFIQPIAPIIISKMGTVIPFLKDIFGELERFFDLVSNKIQH